MSGSHHPAKVKCKEKEDEIELHEIHPPKKVEIEIHGMLTQDMIQDIFIRLPIKSLVRFSAVSKCCNNLFRSPNFIVEHSNLNIQPPSLFLHCNHMSGCGYGSGDIHTRTCTTLNFLPSLTPRGGPTKTTHLIVEQLPIVDHDVRIEGSSNGLLCLTVRELILIWNPATRLVKRLPKPRSGVTSRTCFSFGFTSVANDYKVVLVHGELTKGVEVYSLKTGTWGLCMRDAFAFSFSCYIDKLVATNGSCYGIVTELGLEKMGEWIICFDLGAETFEKINMPTLPPEDVTILAPYKDSIALLVIPDQNIVDLWVHGKVGDCWNMLYSVTPFSPDKSQYLLGVWRDEVLIITEESEEKSLICISNGVENKILATHEARTNYVLSNPYDYVESLVWV